MLLSIIIPTRNRGDFLELCLRALKRSLSESESHTMVEIFVIDDCSDLLTQKRNEKICRQTAINYTFLTTNHGPAYARNRGIEQCCGEWIAFLDDDVCVEKYWFQAFLSILPTLSATDVGIEGAVYTTGTGIWDKEIENYTGGKYLSCNIIYRKDILLSVGCFDEQFIAPCAEDQELSLRVRLQGTISFRDKLLVYHLPKNKRSCLRSIFSSGTRMKNVLDSEFILYMKHPYLYHTCRFASSFWHELAVLLFKHTWINLKRRNILQICSHPIQTLFLIVESFTEQFFAWIFVPRFISRFQHMYSSLQAPEIDFIESAKLWNFTYTDHVKLLSFKPHLFKSLMFPITRQPVYNALSVLIKIKPLVCSDKLQLFLRIDDVFFDDPILIEGLVKVLTKVNIPHLLGLTLSEYSNTQHSQILQQLQSFGSAFGIHGKTHSGKFGPFASEILQLTYPQLERLLQEIDECNNSNTPIEPIAFIPPFNAIGWKQILFLSKQFPIICGGPESARFTHFAFGPLVLTNYALYFPSFYPFYHSSKKMLSAPWIPTVRNIPVPLCISLHADEEKKDGFKSLLTFIQTFQEYFCDWKTLILPFYQKTLLKKDVVS